MELLYGLIKIDKEILTSNNTFVSILLKLILLIVLLVLIKPLIEGLGFIIRTFSIIKTSYLQIPRIKRKQDWTAVTKDRKGWMQGGDALALDFDGRYIKEVEFTVKPLNKPKNWRGGFILGNQLYSPNNIVDNLNAITCHVGSHDYEDTQPVWIYDESHGRDNPHSLLVRSSGKSESKFLVKVNDDNYLTIEINGQITYSRRIDASFRKKAYLLAWGDGTKCRIIFSNIVYYYIR